MAEDSCSYYQEKNKECGAYPTCKKSASVNHSPGKQTISKTKKRLFISMLSVIKLSLSYNYSHWLLYWRDIIKKSMHEFDTNTYSNKCYAHFCSRTTRNTTIHNKLIWNTPSDCMQRTKLFSKIRTPNNTTLLGYEKHH